MRPRLHSRAALVRREEGAAKWQIVRIDIWPAFKAIQACRCDMTALQSRNQRLIIHQAAPPGIDHNRSFGKQCKQIPVYEIVNTLCLRSVQAKTG